MGITIIVYLLLSVWIIPKYVGEKRKLGFVWTMVICVFLSPIVGLIAALISPRI